MVIGIIQYQIILTWQVYYWVFHLIYCYQYLDSLGRELNIVQLLRDIIIHILFEPPGDQMCKEMRPSPPTFLARKKHIFGGTEANH